MNISHKLLLDRLADAIASTWRWLPAAAVLGFAPGWTLWALLHTELAALADNSLAAGPRVAAVRWGLASLLLLLGLYLLLTRRRNAEPFAARAARYNRRLALLAGAPLLVLLAEPELANRHGFAALLTCLALALLAAITAAAWRPATAPDLAPNSPPNAARPLAVLVALATLTVAGLLAYLGVIRHHALVSNIFDLGIFENILWHTIHGDLLGTSIFNSGTFNSEHFAPLLLALAPLYAIVPRAETLIVAQALWLCSATIPLWRWTTLKHGNPPLAAALCLAYLLSPFLHSNALWDFHDLSLGVPLVLWTLWALAADRPRILWPCAAALLFVREEMALVALLLGLYTILEGERRRGALLLLASLLYFTLVATVLAPHAGLGAYPQSLHGNLSQSASYGDLSAVILGDPLFLLFELLRSSKFGLLLALLTPLALLPALGGRILLLLAPGVAILALSANKAVAHPGFHYTSFFLPIVFAAAPLGLIRLERWLARPLAREAAAAIVVAALAFNWSFGALGPSTAFRAGFSTIAWTLSPAERERHAWLTQLAASLPPDACVAATGKPGAHLAGRRCLVRLGDRDDVDLAVILSSELNPRTSASLRALEASGLRRQSEAHGIVVLARDP
ncbi:MAG: DUF2079 domain-containing protein [Nannocystis sp.]|uniref:DUF2079 domain-containing protein n=1 Tax=Nannocystis sp. TaxID=1962667 RepID=UPI0024219814|nr:DUF2079 domain-containing protein [Nannocystis sp.]MBK9758284.1 DUF2079 domain-containing protein [Nannocystis sp.]